MRKLRRRWCDGGAVADERYVMVLAQHSRRTPFFTTSRISFKLHRKEENFCGSLDPPSASTSYASPWIASMWCAITNKIFSFFPQNNTIENSSRMMRWNMCSNYVVPMKEFLLFGYSNYPGFQLKSVLIQFGRGSVIPLVLLLLLLLLLRCWWYRWSPGLNKQ